jgi:hypothetical protein
MSALEQVSVAALENQAFALMARLHVILRRQHGRITDVEYMRQDPAYCRHVIELAMKDATEEVAGICERLEAAFFAADGLFVRIPRGPLLGTGSGSSMHPPPSPGAVAQAFPLPKSDPDLAELPRVESTYVGRLR